jgi:hypothetical protein
MTDNRVETIFQDAAEKAWGATLRATNALILAKTGDEPEKTPLSSRKLDELSRKDGEIKTLRLSERYRTRADSLHGDCFYLGIYDPETAKRRIRETKQYIQDARKLAGRA